MTSNLSKVSYVGTTTFVMNVPFIGEMKNVKNYGRLTHVLIEWVVGVNIFRTVSKRSKEAKIANIVIYSSFSDN